MVKIVFFSISLFFWELDDTNVEDRTSWNEIPLKMEDLIVE